MSYVATIGFFDGVHRGHQFVLERLRDIAEKTGLEPAVITFSEHPQKVLTGGELPLLTTFEERVARLKEEQLKEIFAFSFEIIQGFTAEEFMGVLHRQCGVEMLLMGYDHRFGSDRLSRFEDYQAVADRVGLQLIQLPALPQEINGHDPLPALSQESTGHEAEEKGAQTPSSTRIRKALLGGLIEEANAMLGYRYTLSGEVVEGRHLGRTIGFPTANIAVAEEKLRPLSGVYAAKITDAALGFAERAAIVNIGTNPTVGGTCTTVEAHIPGWEGDLYGRTLHIELTHYLRAEKKFPSLEALKQQIHKDIQEGRITNNE